MKPYLCAMAIVLLPAFDTPKLMSMAVSGARQEAYVETGKALAKYQGYTMMVGDAGLIPYYAGWQAYDSLGLADREIAHNGNSAEYMAKVHPDLIFMYADSDKLRLDAGDTFLQYQYAIKNNYQLLTQIFLDKHYNLWIYKKRYIPGLQSELETVGRNSQLNRVRDVDLLKEALLP